MKKIRVLHIINNLEIGGAEKLLLQITSGLVREFDKYEIRVVTLDPATPLAPEFENKGVSIHALDVFRKPLPVKVWSISKEILRFKPDIVHTHLSSSDGAGFISAFLCGVKRRFSTIHNMEPSTSFNEKVIRIIVSLISEKMIAVSESTKEYSKKIKEFNHEKVIAIYNVPGFIPKNPKPKKFPSDKKIKLANVGRLDEQKGQIFLIRAMKILSQKYDNYDNIELTIYGSDRNGYIKIIEEEIKKNGLKNIKLYGLCDNISEELQKTDIFVSSSLWEGMPLSVIEAISVALPSVLTNIPPHCELLAGIDNYPYFAEPASPESLAEKIGLLIESKDDYEKYSEIILEQSKKFSIEAMLEKYDKLYTS